MRILLILLCGAICSSGLLSAAGAANVAQDPRVGIEAAYRAMDLAVSSKNIQGVFAHKTADYMEIDQRGRTADVNFEKRGIEILFKRAQSVTSTSFITDCHAEGGGEVVTVGVHLVGIFAKPGVKRLIPVTLDFINRDFWVHAHGRWLQKRTRTLRENKTVNGFSAFTR